MQNTKLIDQNPFIVSGYFHVLLCLQNAGDKTIQEEKEHFQQNNTMKI